MKYEGLILTGISCAGKTTIANELIKKNNSFQEVRAYTTRAKRKDDKGHYKYIDKKEFDNMLNGNAFITCTEYRDCGYGISHKDLAKVVAGCKIPILTIAPDSFHKIKNIEEFLVIFIDADDDELKKRYYNRNHKDVDEKYVSQVKIDRTYADAANYLLKNNKVDKTVDLILWLWEYAGTGGKLPQKVIELMIQSDMLIKNAIAKNVQGASYDLTLGDEYFYGGQIKKLSGKNLVLTIEPYDYAIVSCNENISLPKDVTANFGLTVGLFCQGIILSNGQQVDPGFRGKLFCLLFNTSNKAVIIKRHSHYATIEFNKMLDFAPAYKGKNQDKVDILDYMPPNVMQGAINELKKEIEELKIESKNMQNLYMGVIAIIFAAISIWIILN